MGLKYHKILWMDEILPVSSLGMVHVQIADPWGGIGATAFRKRREDREQVRRGGLGAFSSRALVAVWLWLGTRDAGNENELNELNDRYKASNRCFLWDCPGSFHCSLPISQPADSWGFARLNLRGSETLKILGWGGPLVPRGSSVGRESKGKPGSHKCFGWTKSCTSRDQ